MEQISFKSLPIININFLPINSIMNNNLINNKFKKIIKQLEIPEFKDLFKTNLTRRYFYLPVLKV